MRQMAPPVSAKGRIPMRLGRLNGRRPSIPHPRPVSTVASRSTLSRLVALPDHGPGWHNAVVLLEDALCAWALPLSRSRRWMQPTRTLFDQHSPAELFVQYDSVDGIVNIELWDLEGVKLFSADAYLGAPETLDYTLDRRVRAS